MFFVMDCIKILIGDHYVKGIEICFGGNKEEIISYEVTNEGSAEQFRNPQLKYLQNVFS